MTALFGLPVFPLHGVGSRKDLPLPFEAVVIGAAITLVVTFGLLLWAWRSPKFLAAKGIPLPRLTAFVDNAATRWVARSLVAAVWAWFGMALVLGQDRLTNPIFGWVFACLWVGLVPVSLLGGTLFRELHPAWSLGTLLRRRDPDATTLPARVRVWPAALALLVFAWLELIQPGRATLPVLGAFVAAYWVWLVVGVLVFGRAWVRAADPLSAYADLVARLSPWQRIDGVVHLVNPMRHLATEPPAVGTVGLVSVLLGSTAMDSWTGGSSFVRWLQASGAPAIPTLVGILALCVGIVAVTLTGAIALMRRHCEDVRSLVDDLAATCAPIVAGYALAHYTTLLVLEGQRTFITASDPLGRRWNVFGTAELGVNTWLVMQPTLVAIWQAVAIVGGHVLGVVAAHERSLVRLRAGSRVSGQVPLLAVMVGYTIAGLLLLFSA